MERQKKITLLENPGYTIMFWNKYIRADVSFSILDKKWKYNNEYFN